MAEKDSEAPELYTVETAARMTGRNPQVVRRMIAKGIVRAIDHPTDRRAKLIPYDQLKVILAQPALGAVPRTTILAMSDGTMRTIHYMAKPERRKGR